MAVPNLPDSNGVEFLAVRDALSVHGERWVQVQAMVDRKHFVSFELPRFYITGFNDDSQLSHWLAQSARGYVDEVNPNKGESYVRA